HLTTFISRVCSQPPTPSESGRTATPASLTTYVGVAPDVSSVTEMSFASPFPPLTLMFLKSAGLESSNIPTPTGNAEAADGAAKAHRPQTISTRKRPLRPRGAPLLPNACDLPRSFAPELRL